MGRQRCDFHFEYPYPHNNLDRGCQFVEETDVYSCGDKWYCRFHLPLQDDEGNPTTKADLTEVELEAFRNAIDRLIAASVQAKNTVNLSGVVFPNEVSFSERKLPASLWFGASFSDEASFYRTIFLGEAVFTGARFSKKALFTFINFSAPVYFSGVEFCGPSNFFRTTFSSTAQFDGAVFRSYAWFNEANFLFVALFGGARFCAAAGFDNAVFSIDARFDRATFLSNGDFSWSSNPAWPLPGHNIGGKKHALPEPGVFYRLNFSGGRITGFADFSNRTFKDAADFSHRLFEKPPKFHGAKLHQGTKWRGTKFGGTSTPDAEQDYRTLRLAMENIRDRPQEGVFFALEQRAMRQQANWWELRRWLSLAYDLTCSYGRSPGRPLAWLEGVTVVFFLIYLAMSGVDWIDTPLLRDVSVFTFQQLVKPFDVWGRGAETMMPAFTEGQPLVFKFVAAAQSILSFALFTLFILALRWQFRRG